MRGFKNFKGSDARCPSIHFLFYDCTATGMELYNTELIPMNIELNVTPVNIHWWSESWYTKSHYTIAKMQRQKWYDSA